MSMSITESLGLEWLLRHRRHDPLQVEAEMPLVIDAP